MNALYDGVVEPKPSARDVRNESSATEVTPVECPHSPVADIADRRKRGIPDGFGGAIGGLTRLRSYRSGCPSFEARPAVQSAPQGSHFRMTDLRSSLRAKRSNPAFFSFARRKLDCFVAYAPRNDEPRHSRGAISPELRLSFRPERAWGMPGAQCTRSLACKR